VFTNGVFDVLHRGHVACLDQARALGAALVVAVNSDVSVRRLGKGDDRPLNPLADRMAVLAGLEAVDRRPFDDDTPRSLVIAVRPTSGQGPLPARNHHRGCQYRRRRALRGDPRAPPRPGPGSPPRTVKKSLRAGVQGADLMRPTRPVGWIGEEGE
jgi:cytidyltransferase-like protein